MVVSRNKGGTDVKHPRCQQGERQTAPGVWRLGACVSTNIWMYAYESTNKCVSAQVRTSLPVNMSVYVFGLPSVRQQRSSELFSRSLATLIMSGPPKSINQPSAAPLNPQTGAHGSVCMSAFAWLRLNYLKVLTYSTMDKCCKCHDSSNLCYFR